MHLSPRKRSRPEGQLEATVGNTKDLVGDRQRIDIQRWHRKKLLEPGKVIIHEWKNPDLSVISINVEVRPELLVLQYGARPPGDQSEARETISRSGSVLASVLVIMAGVDPGLFVRCRNALDALRLYTARHALPHLPRVRFANL